MGTRLLIACVTGFVLCSLTGCDDTPISLKSEPANPDAGQTLRTNACEAYVVGGHECVVCCGALQGGYVGGTLCVPTCDFSRDGGR